MPCAVATCQRPPHKGRHCSMHAERLRRKGHVGGVEPIRRPNLAGSLTNAGYFTLTGVKHPLAGAQGKLLVNRLVLFEKIGPGGHPCHWCGRPLVWRKGRVKADSILADHLDEDRTNNEPDNLVAACNACNTTRGRS